MTQPLRYEVKLTPELADRAHRLAQHRGLTTIAALVRQLITQAARKELK